MWEVILDAIFQCIKFFYDFCLDWGVAILIITVIFRLLITPLMYKQAESSYRMQKMQPAIKALQTKYADDPVRLNQEQQKMYAEAKFNPLASCVPMLLQMPIFIALFQVLRSMDTRVPDVTNYSFLNIVPNLVQTPGDAIAVGVVYSIPYVLLLAIFAVCTFIPSLLQLKDNNDKQQRNQTLLMTGLMGVMMIFIGFGSPAGVLLFWGASSILAIVQQQGSLAIIKKKDKAAAPIVVVPEKKIEVTRKEQKKRQHKKH